jgi:hypothetical protein
MHSWAAAKLVVSSGDGAWIAQLEHTAGQQPTLLFL